MSARTALVTGASRGIGLDIARGLAEEGYALTLSARREEGLLLATDELRGTTGADILPVVANLADDDAIQRLVTVHAEHSGQLDLLVLNGGVGTAEPVADMTTKAYDLALNINLRAQFLLIQQSLPLLRKAAAAAPSRGSKIVALASITGVAGEPKMAAYGASKAGLISLCETLTLEEGAHGVTATAISPGYVDTDMTAWKRDALSQDAMLATSDVAELVLSVSRLSAHAAVPNIVLTRAGEQIWRA